MVRNLRWTIIDPAPLSLSLSSPAFLMREKFPTKNLRERGTRHLYRITLAYRALVYLVRQILHLSSKVSWSSFGKARPMNRSGTEIRALAPQAISTAPTNNYGRYRGIRPRGMIPSNPSWPSSKLSFICGSHARALSSPLYSPSRGETKPRDKPELSFCSFE